MPYKLFVFQMSSRLILSSLRVEAGEIGRPPLGCYSDEQNFQTADHPGRMDGSVNRHGKWSHFN